MQEDVAGAIDSADGGLLTNETRELNAMTQGFRYTLPHALKHRTVADHHQIPIGSLRGDCGEGFDGHVGLFEVRHAGAKHHAAARGVQPKFGANAINLGLRQLLDERIIRLVGPVENAIGGRAILHEVIAPEAAAGHEASALPDDPLQQRALDEVRHTLDRIEMDVGVGEEEDWNPGLPAPAEQTQTAQIAVTGDDERADAMLDAPLDHPPGLGPITGELAGTGGTIGSLPSAEAHRAVCLASIDRPRLVTGIVEIHGEDPDLRNFTVDAAVQREAVGCRCGGENPDVDLLRRQWRSGSIWSVWSCGCGVCTHGRHHSPGRAVAMRR